MARRSVHQHGLSRAANRQSHSLGRGRRIRPGVWWQGLPVPGGAVGGDRGGDGHVDLVWAVGATAWPKGEAVELAGRRGVSPCLPIQLFQSARHRATLDGSLVRHPACGAWMVMRVGGNGRGWYRSTPARWSRCRRITSPSELCRGRLPGRRDDHRGRIRAALELGAKGPTRGAKKARSTGRELTDDFRFPDRRPARRSGSSEPMGTAIATIVADYGAPIDTVREAAAGRSWHECGTTESPLPETARNLSGRRDSNPRPTAWEALARVATGNDR